MRHLGPAHDSPFNLQWVLSICIQVYMITLPWLKLFWFVEKVSLERYNLQASCLDSCELATKLHCRQSQRLAAKTGAWVNTSSKNAMVSQVLDRAARRLGWTDPRCHDSYAGRRCTAFIQDLPGWCLGRPLGGWQIHSGGSIASTTAAMHFTTTISFQMPLLSPNRQNTSCSGLKQLQLGMSSWQVGRKVGLRQVQRAAWTRQDQ